MRQIKNNTIHSELQFSRYKKNANPHNRHADKRPGRCSTAADPDSPGSCSAGKSQTGGRNQARVTRVALYDGETLISEDTRGITLTSPASYYVTTEKELKKPRIFLTFDTPEDARDTRGKFIIRKK